MQTLVGEIKMIKWGVIPTEPSYQLSVDQMVAGRENLKIVQIVREYAPDYLSSIFHVECVKVDPADSKKMGRSFIWVSYSKEPDFIQYFIPDEAHDYIKI